MAVATLILWAGAVWCIMAAWCVPAVGQTNPSGPPPWESLAPPVVKGRWVRPSAKGPAQPIWGHADGLRIALHPSRGPRGLLRVFAPYLRHREDRHVNFIAIEPIVAGESHRGFSELEPSKLDGVQGKRFWSVDDPSDTTPRVPWEPVQGQVVRVDGVEALRVYIQVEPFDSGARVCLRLTFRADRPHEVGIATVALEGSRPLSHCVITATMGNFARLRELHLSDRVVRSTELWPDYTGDAFTPHATFPLAEMKRLRGGQAIVAATPDEANPEDAIYAPDTRKHWHYTGRVATQYWRCENPRPELTVKVNGRYTYWASKSPIPGGISYENFEFFAPFRQGDEYWFGVTPGRELRLNE